MDVTTTARRRKYGCSANCCRRLRPPVACIGPDMTCLDRTCAQAATQGADLPHSDGCSVPSFDGNAARRARRGVAEVIGGPSVAVSAYFRVGRLPVQVRWVPPWSGVVMARAPWWCSARRRMLVRPLERVGVPRPWPLSVISRVSRSWTRAMEISSRRRRAQISCCHTAPAASHTGSGRRRAPSRRPVNGYVCRRRARRPRHRPARGSARAAHGGQRTLPNRPACRSSATPTVADSLRSG